MRGCLRSVLLDREAIPSWYESDGVTVEVDGWRGMQGHNWGTRHTELYAWGHCNDWEGHDDLVLEGVTACVKVGRILAPPLTVVCVTPHGRALRLQRAVHAPPLEGDDRSPSLDVHREERAGDGLRRAPDFARDTSLTTLGRGFFRVGFGAGSSK